MEKNPPKYFLPSFLKGRVSQESYARWLRRKAQAHRLRDKKRVGIKLSAGNYRDEIHEAVLRSRGLDAYTGKPMRWELISTFNNEEAKIGGVKYKSTLKDLPTVDHEWGTGSEPKFNICSWAVNDAKNDLPLKDFIKLCKLVVKYSCR